MGSLSGKPELTTATVIANDAFWPSISLGDLVAKYRIPSEYDNAVITNQLALSASKTNSYLAGLKAMLLADGHTTMVSYASALPVSLATSAVLHYENAVYSRAKAMLLQHFNTMTQKKVAENSAKTSDESYEYFLTDAADSVSLLIEMFGAARKANGDYGTGFYVGLI